MPKQLVIIRVFWGKSEPIDKIFVLIIFHPLKQHQRQSRMFQQNTSHTATLYEVMLTELYREYTSIEFWEPMYINIFSYLISCFIHASPFWRVLQFMWLYCNASYLWLSLIECKFRCKFFNLKLFCPYIRHTVFWKHTKSHTKSTESQHCIVLLSQQSRNCIPCWTLIFHWLLLTHLSFTVY